MKRVETMNTLGAILLLLSVTLWAASGSPRPQVGQQSPTAKQKVAAPSTGELSGFVFLITKGGDIKPARLASVTLLYYAERQLAPDDKGPLLTAGREYLINRSHEITKEYLMLKQESDTGNFKSEEAHCPASLLGYVGALKSTVEWAVENKKMSQILTVDADEEGRFKALRVPVGLYTVTVYGRAGVNQAFWEQDNVQVTADNVTSMKMTTPKKACVQP
jgi:hypothetical protein